MDPSTDTYYFWLCTISVPVFYNLIFLVARSGTRYSHLPDYCCFFQQVRSLLVFPSFRSCFNELQYRNTVLWMSLDYTSDFLYLLDTFVRARTGL